MQSKKVTAIISGIIIATITIIVLKTMVNLSLMLAAIAGFIIGGGVTIILIARSRGEKPQDIVKEVVKEAVNPTPDSLSHRVEEKLLQLNLQLRLETTHTVIIDKCEELIDNLLDIVPRAIKESPDSEASFDLEKLSTDYFPDLMNNFLSLSDSDQQGQQAELLSQLAQLIDTAEKAKQSLDKGNLNDFKVSSAFLTAKHK
jgi:hypothetical protein